MALLGTLGSLRGFDDEALRFFGALCVPKKLNPNVAVMKPTEDRL